MNDNRLQFKLLSNEWNKVKGKRIPRKCWLARVNSLKKELNRQNLGDKTNQKTLDKKSMKILRYSYNLNQNGVLIRN